MTPPKVMAVVLNWNDRDAVGACLRSLLQTELPCQITVVDNGSTDGSPEHVARIAPGANLIALPRNVGPSAARNVAVRQALQTGGPDYFLFLDNDTLVHPQALAHLVQAASLHPNAGLLGAKVYYRDQPQRIWYGGAQRGPLLLEPRGTGRGQRDEGQFAQLRPVDYVFTVAVLVRRVVFQSIGLFDERFSYYFEDLDLCLRARAAGYDLLFVPDAQVWHIGSASMANNRLRRYGELLRGAVHLLPKHSPLFAPFRRVYPRLFQTPSTRYAPFGATRLGSD